MQAPNQEILPRPKDVSLIKLRTTCDNCAAAKVKCNQQKPSCRRCIGLKIGCVYGPSRRKGKPGFATRKLNSTRWSTESQPTESSRNALISPGSIHPFGWLGLNDWQPLSRHALNSEHDNALSHELMDGSLWKYSPSSANSPEIELPIPDSDFPNPMTTCFPGTEYGSSSNLSMERTPAEKNMAGLFNLQQGLQPMHDGCLSNAFDVLQNLYQLGSRGQPRGMDNEPTFDQVLRTNNSSVRTLEALLQCSSPTCQRDFHMHYLLATICSKILGWYRSVYMRNIVQSEQQAPQDEQLPTPPSQETDVMQTIITVGDFKVDHLADRRMKAQLLLCELQKIKKVFDGLSERISGNSGRFIFGQKGVHDAFDQFLRKDLNDMVGRLNDFCMLKY